MLEPRRLAAKSVAFRMADLLDEKVGDTVGCRIRFENKSGKNTRIEVITEGILTRLIQKDNTLDGIGLVIEDIRSMSTTKENIHWDTRNGNLVSRKELCIGDLVLEHAPLTHVPTHIKLKILTQVLKTEGESLLPWNAQTSRWQARINSLKNGDQMKIGQM